MARFRNLVLSTVALALTACGGGGGGSNPPPSNPLYRVSVSVSGLSGSVVLQNNGGNNLTVGANGSATFTTALASGSAYAVSVLTQPAGQTCTVTSGGGTIAAANVSISVSCINNPAAGPVAAFTAPANADAFDAVPLDASTSTGTTLTYSWDFGDGRKAGGQKVSTVFATGGTKTVTLRVTDGAGASSSTSKQVTVTAPPAPTSVVRVQGTIKSIAEVALADVSVTTPDGANAISDASGKVTINVGTNVSRLLKLSKSGYADQFVQITLPPGTGDMESTFDAVMRTRDAALTLADATAGGSVAGRDGATVTLGPGVLVDSTGAAVSGAVQIAITPIDVTQPGGGGFPGQFEGLTTAGTSTPIVSYGTTEYVLTRAGQPLQLAPGKTATIELPLYADTNLAGTAVTLGDRIPLWSLDETTGLWIHEGDGEVVASAASPTGFAMRATVSHFSWWNIDIGFDPFGPQPDCVPDSSAGIPENLNNFANATMCSMLAEMERDGESNAKISAAALPIPPAFSRRFDVPLGGLVTTAVPANADIMLTASALNATWYGSLRVRGPIGLQQRVEIPMRPVAMAGDETITLPFDDVRAINAGQTGRFTFTGTAQRWAVLNVSQAPGSMLNGTVELRQGANVIATAPYSALPASVGVQLPANGPYTLSISNAASQAGSVRIRVELADAGGTEAIALPFDGTRQMPSAVVSRFTFNATTPRWLNITAQRSSSTLNGTVRVLYGTTVLGTANFGSSPASMTLALPANGAYTIEVIGLDNTPGAYRLQASLQGGAQDETITLPFDLTRPVPAFTTWRGNVSVATTTGLALSLSTLSGQQVALRVRDSAGAIMASITRATNGTYPGAAVELVPGDYTIETSTVNGAAAEIQMAGELTRWIDVAPPIDAGTLGAVRGSGLVRDRNDRLVVLMESNVIVNNTQQAIVTLLRWNGTSWQDVAPALPTIANPCVSSIPAGVVAFDADNRPWIAYVERRNGSESDTRVRRFDGTNWVSVGGDALNYIDGFSRGCDVAPVLRFDASGAAVIAYRGYDGSNTFVAVARFDGTNWNGYVSSTADRFNVIGGRHDFGFDGTGRPVLVWNQSTGGTTVRRLNTAPTPAWEGVGSVSGALPAVPDYWWPRLLFDAGGNPIVAGFAYVETTPGVYTMGAAVSRYNGTTWQSTGPYRVSSNSYLNWSYSTLTGPAVTRSGSQLVWVFQSEFSGGSGRVLAQSNNAGGWAVIGSGFGEIPQLYPHGNESSWSQDFVVQSLGSDVYLMALVRPGSGGGPSRIRLLRMIP